MTFLRPKLGRRTLLRASSAAALGALAGCPPPGRDGSCCGGAAGSGDEHGSVVVEPPAADRGALPPTDPLIADPNGILDLPSGFSYRVLQRGGEPLSDGYRMPARPDAMGCFAGRSGSLVLMRNHELTAADVDMGPCGPGQNMPAEAYDRYAPGGVTRLVLDPDTLAIRSSNLVLTGTYWNCAGGLSPWGWLSCEETVQEGHGHVFLCSTDSERVAKPHPIFGYGRFRHEAATVDPQTSIAYLTEDEVAASFYRFLPSDPSNPFSGKLQALRVIGNHNFDTGTLLPGTHLRIDWVDVADPNPATDTVRTQAQANGAAIFRRTEGLWLGKGEVYFSATIGGPINRGQIFRLTLGEQPMLDVIAVSTDPNLLDMPDNLCVSPHGQLYVAEDSLDGSNFIRRVTLAGEVQPFARNALSYAEFAGLCFSPDGRHLFANLQEDHMTLAISGPFERLGKPKSAQLGSIFPSFGGAVGGLAVLALAALRDARLR